MSDGPKILRDLILKSWEGGTHEIKYSGTMTILHLRRPAILGQEEWRIVAEHPSAAPDLSLQMAVEGFLATTSVTPRQETDSSKGWKFGCYSVVVKSCFRGTLPNSVIDLEPQQVYGEDLFYGLAPLSSEGRDGGPIKRFLPEEGPQSPAQALLSLCDTLRAAQHDENLEEMIKKFLND
jgi:hypothetical protein